MTTPVPRDVFMPQPLAGRGFGFVLAALAHGLLLLALTLAVNWRVSSTSSPIEAELWAEIPRAAPPAVAPPPPPPAVEPDKPAVKPPEARVEPKPSRAEQDAQIATEKAKREKEREELEKKRKEEEKKQAEKKAEQERRDKAEKEAQQKEKAKEKEAQLAREEAQRQQNIARMMKDANKQPAGPTSSDFGADYAGQVQKRIRDNTDFPANVDGNRAAEVEIRVSPDGRILGQRILKSSGNTAFDEAILRGVERAGSMPRNRDGVAPSPIIAVIRARE